MRKSLPGNVLIRSCMRIILRKSKHSNKVTAVMWYMTLILVERLTTRSSVRLFACFVMSFVVTW